MATTLVTMETQIDNHNDAGATAEQDGSKTQIKDVFDSSHIHI